MSRLSTLLTRKEAATILNKPPSWLRYAERHGLVPFIRVGQHIRYDEEDLRRWIDGHRVAPNARPTDAEGGLR